MAAAQTVGADGNASLCSPANRPRTVRTLVSIVARGPASLDNKEISMTRILPTLAIVTAIALIGGASGCASTATHEGTGQYVDDSVITGKVKTAIFNEPSLKSAEINVETFKGVVQLSGFVSSAENQKLAMDVARKVPGVTSVKDDMRLK
jgi:hypothetical protein